MCSAGDEKKGDQKRARAGWKGEGVGKRELTAEENLQELVGRLGERYTETLQNNLEGLVKVLEPDLGRHKELIMQILLEWYGFLYFYWPALSKIVLSCFTVVSSLFNPFVNPIYTFYHSRLSSLLYFHSESIIFKSFLNILSRLISN